MPPCAQPPPSGPSQAGGAAAGGGGGPGLLGDLNEAQREAVTDPAPALLIVAGAGTGKTRVLTRRVAWLVGEGLAPWAVLALTFTNKAADVLRGRLAALGLPSGVFAGTFHSLGAWLLRRHGAVLGIDPRFTILDREDQQRLVRDVAEERGLPLARRDLRDWIACISHAKGGGEGPRPLAPGDPEADALFHSLLEGYERRLRQAQLLDFDDLLGRSVELLQADQDVRAACHARFAHLLVDEYQDTNRIQRDLLLALRGAGAGITAVGDPDQSIYRWRGAAVRNILAFSEDFPGARVRLLERNYRSTGAILAVAEAVIARNHERYPKQLHTRREAGRRVRVLACGDPRDEGEAIVRLVTAWRAAGRRPDEIAVLYRVNYLSRGIEQALRLAGVPYAVIAGVEFFQRQEVKDLLAYARLVLNPRDEAAFRRVVNTPRRGVGAASLQRLGAFAAERGLTLFEAAVHPENGVGGRARAGLAALVATVEAARRGPPAAVATLLGDLVRATGYREMLRASDDPIERAREENLDELLAAAREFDEHTPEGGLTGFLERTALVSDQDAVEEDAGRVSLMTVHAAKGLEYPCVVVAGVEDGLFPHERSAAQAGGPEEERRLFYVALTRAQDELVLTTCARRMRFTGLDWSSPSPFLGDLPPEHVEACRTGAALGPGPFGGPLPDRVREAPAVAREPARTAPAAWAVGDRVRHPHFGEGRLEAVGGTGAELRVTVDFDQWGRKQLLVRYARLEPAR